MSFHFFLDTLPQTPAKGIVLRSTSNASVNLPSEMSATNPCALTPAGQVAEQGDLPSLSMVYALGMACANGR